MPRRIPPSISTVPRPATASATSGRASRLAGTWSSWRPPWFETTTPAAPCSIASAASSAVSTPLTRTGSEQPEASSSRSGQARRRVHLREDLLDAERAPAAERRVEAGHAERRRAPWRPCAGPARGGPPGGRRRSAGSPRSPTRPPRRGAPGSPPGRGSSRAGRSAGPREPPPRPRSAARWRSSTGRTPFRPQPPPEPSPARPPDGRAAGRRPGRPAPASTAARRAARSRC